MNAKSRPKAVLEAKIIRADGTEIDLGVIADSKDPDIVKKIQDFLKRKLKGGCN